MASPFTIFALTGAIASLAPAASAPSSTGPLPGFEDTVRCLALDDTYWVMIMSAGAGERTEADMAWRQKTETRMYAEGSKKGLSKDQVNSSYSAVFNPFQETFLDDKLMAERNKCRAAK
jgi:transcription elongation factor